MDPVAACIRLLRYILVALVVIVSLMIAGRVNAHDFYSDLKQPGTELSCCNSKAHAPNGDCEPTLARHSNGQWHALHNGKWMSIPNEKVLTVESPDGKAHVCVGKHSGVVLCFIVPLPET